MKSKSQDDLRLDTEEKPSPVGRPAKSLVIWLAVLFGCVGLLVYLVLVASGPKIPPLLDGPDWQRQSFFDEQVVPAITRCDNANRVAVNLCIKRIKDMFEKQRQGVPGFTEDMTSWGTRWSVVKRMPGDWWNESNSVTEFVSGKFEAHLFSVQSFQDGIDKALAGFRSDVAANNVRLLTQVKAAVTTSDLPSPPNLSDERFHQGLTERIQKFSADAGADSVTSLVVKEIIAGTGGAAAGQLTTLLAAQLFQAISTTATTAGGTTATTTVAGGASGSAAGPWGTCVGAGVGLVVGLAIDWWMTEKFEEKLQTQLITMINQMEQRVLKGSDGNPGLKAQLYEACDQFKGAYQQTFHDTLLPETI